MSRTAGQLNNSKLHGSALTAGALEKAIGPLLHPTTHAKLKGSGLFSSLSNIIGFANKAYGAIDKGIKIGTKAYSAGQSFKKAYDGMKGGDIDMSDAIQGDMVVQAKPRRKRTMVGVNGAGQRQIEGAGLKEKKKRTLPEALRKRATRMGELMKMGHSMKKASEIYKEEQKK